jgi:hypothetical protein
LKFVDESDERTYKIDRNYSNLTKNLFISILNKMLNPEFNAYFDDENRFLVYTRPMRDFSIIDMSYNFKIVTGYLKMKLPFHATARHVWVAPRKRYLSIQNDEYLIHGEDYFIIEETIRGVPYRSILRYRGETIQLSTVTDYKLRTIINDMLLPHETHGFGKVWVRFLNRYNLNKNDKYEYLVLLRDWREITLIYMTPSFAKIAGSIIQEIDLNPPPGSYPIIYPPMPKTTISGAFHTRFDTVGYFNLTPVLYLISNIGSTCYSNSEDDQGNIILDNRQIAMRINNYFITGLPIISNNIEFTAIVPSGSLTNVWFRLVDGNYQPVKLLCPMYLSIVVMGIDDKPVQLQIYHSSE